MNGHRINRSGVRINHERLRYERERKNLTQRDLAQKAHFSEDYISQLERASTTRNKGMGRRTIWRLAQTLEIPYENLLLPDPVECLQINWDQHTLLELIANKDDFHLAPAQLKKYRQQKKWTQRDLAQKAHFSEDYISQLERGLNTPTTPETIFILAQALEIQPGALLSQYPAASQDILPEPPPTTSPLVYEFKINTRGLWLKEEKRQLEIRTKHKPGDEEWAKITLHCAWMRQQAGDVIGAKAHIQEVEQYALRRTDQLNPGIIARIHNQRGWLEDEQYGNFEQALMEFDIALKNAQIAGDITTGRTARYFRFRILSEQAMTESGAWLGARPLRTLSTQRIRQLQQSLEEDMPIVHQLEPDNPHADYREFLVNALIHRWDARGAITTLRDKSKDTDTERFMTLNLARWDLSNEEWNRASGLAAESFEGFSQAAFPQGIAYSSAIQAEALLQNGLKTKEDCHFCLDLWLLALLLHSYASHPLWQIAYAGLSKTVRYVAERSQSWMDSYSDEVDERARNREDKFQALKYSYVEESMATPSQYIRRFYRPQ